MYFNNIAASRPDAGEDSFLQLLNSPPTGMRFGLSRGSNNMNQHHSDRTQTNIHAKHLRSTFYPQPPQMTILPQWAPYIYPEEDQLFDGDDVNGAVAVNTNGDDQNQSKTGAGQKAQKAQNLNEPLLSSSSPSTPSSSHFNQQLPPPGWTSVHLFGKSHPVAPPAALYTDPKSLSIQIIKSTLDPNFIPFDPLSTRTQDGLKLGQSQLVPQESVALSNFQVETLTGDFVEEQWRVLQELDGGVLDQNYSGSSVNDEMGYNSCFASKMSQNPTALASQPMITAPTPVVFQQDGVYHQRAVIDSNNNNINKNNPDKLLSSPSPTMTKLRSALVTATVVASKLPKKGFLYSDDTLIRSYLPHHTHGHDKASLIHQLPPQHGSSSSYYNNTNHSSYDSHHHSSSTATTITTSRYQHSISSRPITQQNLPDMITGFTDNIIPGGSMNTQTPLVTPVNLISSDAYRQLSLPTHHFNNKLEKRIVGCCHRTKLPSFLSFLFSALTDVQLDTPAVRPNRHFHAYQQGTVNLIYNYRSELTPGPSDDGNNTKNNSNKNNKEKKKFPGLAQKLSQISPTLPHLITKHLISSLKESFSSPILVHRTKPVPPQLDSNSNIPHDTTGTTPVSKTQKITSYTSGLNPTNLQHNPYILPSDGVSVAKFKTALEDFWTRNGNKYGQQRYATHLDVNPTYSSPSSLTDKDPIETYLDGMKMYYSQPDIPLFGESHVHQFLFSSERSKIKIWPFNNLSIFSPSLSSFFTTRSPSVSLAQLFSSCFRCLRSPMNLIDNYNRKIEEKWETFESTLFDHFEEMYFANDIQVISADVVGDIHLQVGSPSNFVTPGLRQVRHYPDAMDLLHHFEFIYSTPLFYKIQPKAMFHLILLLKTSTRPLTYFRENLDSNPRYGMDPCYLIKDYDGYGLLTALIRWGVYWESVKYVSHIEHCPILKNLKKMYISIVKHSISIFSTRQDRYLLELNQWTEEYLEWEMNEKQKLKSKQQQLQFPSQPLNTATSSTFASSSSLAATKKKADKKQQQQQLQQQSSPPSSSLLLSSQPISSSSSHYTPIIPLKFTNPPLPPQFTFEIPPEIQHKYSNFSTFLNSTNPCEICNTYRDVRIVHKPWAQPLQSTPFNHTSPQYRHHATQPLPTTVFDLNLFNLPLFDGFSNTGGLDTHVQPQSQSQSQSPKSPSTPSTCTSFPHLHNHSLRYDMASGKLHELMGQALSISPETLAQLNLPIETWETILNPNQHKKTSVHADNLTFAAIYHADRGEFEPVDTINNKNHGYYKGSGGGNQNNTQNATPTPHQEHKRLSSTILHHQPLSDAYGIYIPTHLVRKQLSPMLTMFATMTFTSSQLASLFQPPSIFTEYEQFFILMSREIGDGCASSEDQPQVPTVRNDVLYNQTLSAIQTQTFPYGDSIFRSPSHESHHPWKWDPGMRYECQILDIDGASNNKKMILSRYENEKGLAQSALNPNNFNQATVSRYFTAVNELLYDRYQDKQDVWAKRRIGYQQQQHGQQDQGEAGDTKFSHLNQNPSQLDRLYNQIDANDARRAEGNIDTQNDPYLYLNSMLSKHQHRLNSQILSEPGYRDGIYYFHFRTYHDTLNNHFPDVLKYRGQFEQFKNSKPVDFTEESWSFFITDPVKNNGLLNPIVQRQLNRFANYTLAFPKSQFTGDAIEPTIETSTEGFIQAEYLLQTQKYTKIAVLNDIVVYPYLEMKGVALGSGLNELNNNWHNPSQPSLSPQQQSQRQKYQPHDQFPYGYEYGSSSIDPTSSQHSPSSGTSWDDIDHIPNNTETKRHGNIDADDKLYDLENNSTATPSTQQLQPQHSNSTMAFISQIISPTNSTPTLSPKNQIAQRTQQKQKTLETTPSQFSQQAQQLQQQQPIKSHITTTQQPQSTFYYAPTTSGTPLAPELILGSAITRRQYGKATPKTVATFRQGHFSASTKTHTCVPDALICWNWYILPTLMTLIAAILIVLFGLIYTKKIEATPTSLCLMPTFAFFIFLFPYLFWCQQYLTMPRRRWKICGMRKCCGISATEIHPSKDRWMAPRMIEQAFTYSTFGPLREYSSTPSISRFFSTMFIAWLLISVYCTWTDLYQFSLVAIFVPSYVLLALSIATCWHKVYFVGTAEAIPSFTLLISLGVLHAALADKDNTHYNAIAVFAPFLVWITIGIVASAFMTFSMFCRDDWGLNLCSILVCFLLFLGAAAGLSYVAFLLLLLQDLIRPGTWWVPSYWAVHFLTYPAILIMLFSLWVESDYPVNAPINIPRQKGIHPLDSTEINHVGTLTLGGAEHVRV